jgi:hypothetical protein
MSAGGDPAEMRRRLAFTDALLLEECELHTYRASGPGGQKRNKTSSAVRLHHRPSGLTATGTESRSQHENKARALVRLREAIAVHYRAPLATARDWPSGVISSERTLHVSARNPHRLTILAEALDALAAAGGQTRDAAEACGVTPSSFVRFLAEVPAAWAEVGRIRGAAGLPPLRSPG